MKLKRNELFYNLILGALGGLIEFYNEIESSGIENIPKEGPALILPKHQAYRDIIIEGQILRTYCNRSGNWVMKSSLPDFFKYIGAVKIIRFKEIRKRAKKIKNEGKRREFLEESRLFNQRSMEYIEFLYKNNELVVAHPEGTRVRNKMGTVKTGVIDVTREIQERLGIKIPVIPMGIEYNPFSKFRSKVYVRVGEPLDVNTFDLEKIVENEIRKLSNI